MSEDEQAVADTEAEATPEAEESGEQDIGELLNEFEESEPKPEEPKEESEAEKRVNAFLFQQKMEKATSLAKEASGLDLPGDFFEDRIEGEARRNPKFLNAFLNAEKSPDAFNKLMGQIGKDVAKQFDTFMSTQTGDNDAIASAVRSAKPASDPGDQELAKKVRDASPAEFQKNKKTWLRQAMKEG